uniref:Uncharacterized protein n=1 Tax=Tanacetum cinerariifolium TaxID=118510 RepID=A0A6L2KEK6_TANCI|nr:hypothetical protein [Tanacetum cinerariifolium]
MDLMMAWNMIHLMSNSEWLASKFYNHGIKDWYTKNALCIYWARGNDEVELYDEESSYPNDENLIDENKVAEIFRIKTNLFDFKTPSCIAFKEFNYLLQIDPGILTKDIQGFKTYDEYIDDWIYEWNKDVPWDDYENATHYPEQRCKDTTYDAPVCRIKRHMMIKYSFRDDEKYVAIKEDEYDDFTSTSEEACRAYQEIFRMMDEGWMVTRDERRKLKKKSNLETSL